jgi:hypothetical protein
MTQKELEQKVIDAEGRVAKREAVLKKHNSQLAKMIKKGADRFDISIKREDIKSATSKLAEALKPVINAVLSALKKLWKVSTKAIGVPPKWLHLAAHAKKARTRKKYRNRIRRYVFEALAAEGGGGP